MRSTRSGAPPRFLLYRSPENWVIRSELLVFNFLFGFVPLLALILGAQSCGLGAAGSLFDPSTPMHRLGKRLNPAEEARGVVRAGGTLEGGSEVCLLIHQYKSGKNWSEDWRATIGGDATIRYEYWNALPLQFVGDPLRVDWSHVRWEPTMVTSDSARETAWRQRVSIPAGGRLSEACLHPGAQVFIDACLQSDRGAQIAGPCGARPAVVTPGDGTPQPRIDQLAASAAGEIATLGGAALLILLYLWRVLGARPFIAALIRRLRQAPGVTLGKSALWVIGLAPIGLCIAFYLSRAVPGGPDGSKVDRYGYAVAYGVFGGALILGLLMRDRRRVLRALIDATREEEPISLARLAADQRVALDAEVDLRAPLSTAQLTGARRAYSSVSVTRVYRSGKNYSAQSEPDRHGSTMIVPIRAPSGAALLDLTHASVDLRALRIIARKRALKRGDFVHLLGQQAPFDGAYMLEERFLDPGEAIYIAGKVQRIEAPSTEMGYREAGAVPVIGGTPDQPVVIHAGSRRSLLRGLVLERGFLDVALGLTGAIGLATAGLVAYLVNL